MFILELDLITEHLWNCILFKLSVFAIRMLDTIILLQFAHGREELHPSRLSMKSKSEVTVKLCTHHLVL